MAFASYQNETALIMSISVISTAVLVYIFSFNSPWWADETNSYGFEPSSVLYDHLEKGNSSGR